MKYKLIDTRSETTDVFNSLIQLLCVIDWTDGEIRRIAQLKPGEGIDFGPVRVACFSPPKTRDFNALERSDSEMNSALSLLWAAERTLRSIGTSWGFPLGAKYIRQANEIDGFISPRMKREGEE